MNGSNRRAAAAWVDAAAELVWASGIRLVSVASGAVVGIVQFVLTGRFAGAWIRVRRTWGRKTFQRLVRDIDAACRRTPPPFLGGEGLPAVSLSSGAWRAEASQRRRLRSSSNPISGRLSLNIDMNKVGWMLALI